MARRVQHAYLTARIEDTTLATVDSGPETSGDIASLLIIFPRTGNWEKVIIFEVAEL